MLKKERKIVFPLVKSTTEFIMRCKGLLSLSTPLTVFQWTVHNSGHLDFTVSSLNCGISLLVENPEERPCCFPPTTLLSDFIKGLWDGRGQWAQWCWGKAVGQASPPGLPGPHAPPPPHPRPFQQKPGRLGQASSNSGYLSYLFSVLAEPQPQHNQEGLSWKAGMQIKTKITDLHLCF